MEEVRRINEKGQLVCAVEFDGVEYRRYPKGKHPNYYYHKWKENGVFHSKMLHHAIYEKAFGVIPKGMVIHHKDFNPLNNEISNLVMLTNSAHMQIHRTLAKWTDSHKDEHLRHSYSKSNWNERREKVLSNLKNERRVCRWCGNEFTPTNTHQKFCSNRCHHKWQYKSAENDIQMVCQYCGKNFFGNKYLKPKTCSSECAHNLTISSRNKRD